MSAPEEIRSEVGRCGATAEPALLGGPPFYCRLPHGHAGMHHAEAVQPGTTRPVVSDWWDPEPAPKDGVWIVAYEIPHDGIVMAIPYASEIDALRAINKGLVYSDVRAYFVPFGKDLHEVMS